MTASRTSPKSSRTSWSVTNCPSNAVLSYDETRSVQNGDKLVLQRIAAANNQRAHVRFTRHQAVASILSFVAADKSVLRSVYIIKAEYGKGEEATVDLTMEEAPCVSRGTWPRYFFGNNSRYLAAQVFREDLTIVAEEFRAT